MIECIAIRKTLILIVKDIEVDNNIVSAIAQQFSWLWLVALFLGGNNLWIDQLIPHLKFATALARIHPKCRKLCKRCEQKDQDCVLAIRFAQLQFYGSFWQQKDCLFRSSDCGAKKWRQTLIIYDDNDY